ncbi:MAG: carboxypeptidase regulatory-like domain-containing protein [Verrucomicrobiota bacterium]|jgi:protocatechuate 3,4-dioxygenase beta subunit
MKTTRQFLLVAAVAAFMGACLHAQTQQQLQTSVQRVPDTGATAGAPTLKLSGTVTDTAGNPVAGATVEYWRFDENRFQAGLLTLIRQVATETNGAFAFQVSREQGCLLARKPGLAPAWKLLNLPFNSVPDMEAHLVLTPPASLAGVVVDEADKPVVNAEVSVVMAVGEMSPEGPVRTVNFIIGKPAHDCFAARTDAAGRFRIESFPTNATAALAVQAPGKALRQSEPNFAGLDSLPWRAGQDDIKLVVDPAGSIEGKITVEDSNQPPPVARLILQPDGPGFFALGEREPSRSGPDGAFNIRDVAAGSYRIQAVFGTNAVKEWVADTVPVSVESGQITRGVQITAARGGLLEVAVMGQDDRKPLAQVMVNAYKQNSQSAASSDSNGVVRLRLLPGDYQVMASRASVPGNQTSASVAAGQTNRVEIEIVPPKKITGIVRQPDGQPAAGLPVKIVGGFGGPNAAGVKTDAGGKFELEWNQRQFGGQNDSTVCILVRDTEHNLAAAQDIDEDTGALDLKLAPGLTLAGRAESDGKPVTNATAQLVFWSGNRGMWLQGLARTNTPGQYEIPALPPGRKYGVIVSAPGYGQKQNHNLEISADPGRQELDTVELKPANLKLAGQVLDADDKPVPGTYVNLNGDGQPSGNARTDREGRFRFEHVCEGSVQLSASSQRSFGNISAEGGDTNVVLRLGQTYSSSPGAQTHKLKGVVTDADGKPAAGAQVVVFPNNGTRWIKTGTNGQYNLTWSLQPWQAQNGGAYFVARDPASNLAAVEELTEETTNLDVKLKPALTLAGQVKNAADAPLPGAQVGLWFKAGNTYAQVDEQIQTANAGGRYEIKCLPADGQYMVYATAKGYGRSQRQIENDSETNLLEVEPFVLKPADQIIAGQVLNENEKPASGVNVQLNGNDQPNGNTTTDSKGRFHFQVCEGRVSLFAYSQNGGGNAQATVEAGDTNIVMTMNSNPGIMRQTPPRASLKGNPLPDLTTVNLAADAAPAAKPVLLCLFDAAQRPSRHVVSQLEQQAAALRQQNVSVLGVQAAVTGDEIFNEWKSASLVSFPIGRVTEKSEKSKWASAVPALPWLILTDANHRVIAEGFALDDLDAQVKKLAK